MLKQLLFLRDTFVYCFDITRLIRQIVFVVQNICLFNNYVIVYLRNQILLYKWSDFAYYIQLITLLFTTVAELT